MNEMDRFVDAFERLIKRDEFPTPTKLNLEMGRPGSGNNLPGRLSRRRRELLTAAGYEQAVTRRDDDGNPIHWSHWRKRRCDGNAHIIRPGQKRCVCGQYARREIFP